MKSNFLSCDLLSNQYLCPIGNSRTTKSRNSLIVVICFQISIFVLLETATPPAHASRLRCDLLSNQYLCPIGNSITLMTSPPTMVVICFQISIFVLLETAQHTRDQQTDRCDLLSNQYLCPIGNSKKSDNIEPKQVVICFQISIFVLLETASEISLIQQCQL